MSCARFFCCLKQDGQDAQDEQDDSTSPRGCRAPPKTIGARVAIAIKVLTDLFSWLRPQSIDIKVFQTFFSLILSILSILAILLQTIAIKVLTDLFSWLRLCSIDIQVLSDLQPSFG